MDSYGLVTEQKKGSYQYFVDLGDRMEVAKSKTVYVDQVGQFYVTLDTREHQRGNLMFRTGKKRLTGAKLFMAQGVVHQPPTPKMKMRTTKNPWALAK